MMVDFIDAHRNAHGVKPICEGVPITPSTCYDRLAERAEPARQFGRVKRDEALRPEIQRVFGANCQVCGTGKVWQQLHREGLDVGRCTVAWLRVPREGWQPFHGIVGRFDRQSNGMGFFW